MVKMASMPIYGNQGAAGTGGLGILKGKKVGKSEYINVEIALL